MKVGNTGSRFKTRRSFLFHMSLQYLDYFLFSPISKQPHLSASINTGGHVRLEDRNQTLIDEVYP